MFWAADDEVESQRGSCRRVWRRRERLSSRRAVVMWVSGEGLGGGVVMVAFSSSET